MANLKQWALKGLEEAAAIAERFGKSAPGISLAVEDLFKEPPFALRPVEATLGGVQKKTLYETKEGEQWLFKHDARRPAMLREHAAHEIGRLVGEPVADSMSAMVEGKEGFLQKMFPGARSLTSGELGGLSPEQGSDILHSNVFDLAIQNRDLHAGNYVALPNGSIRAIDKGFAFPMGMTHSASNEMWGKSNVPSRLMSMVSTRDFELPKNTLASTMDYAHHIASIPDEKFADILKNIYAPPRGAARSIRAELKDNEEQLIQTALEAKSTLPQRYSRQLELFGLEPPTSSARRQLMSQQSVGGFIDDPTRTNPHMAPIRSSGRHR